MWRAIAATIGLAAVSAGQMSGQTLTSPPGGIRLLDGYRHEQLQGIDTHVGRIWKTDGPQINYDIGQLAGNHARGADAPLWSKRQTIGGHALTLTRLDARSMVLTFDRDTANFFVQGLKTEEDFADVLLMLLSYTPGVR